MNSNNINNYILDLENENNNLKKNNDELNYKNNEYKEELENLIKVSIITNLNKQLKEKQDLIIILNNEIRLLKIKLKNNIVPDHNNVTNLDTNMVPDNHLDTNIVPDHNLDTTIIPDPNTVLNHTKKSKTKRECQIIKYKNKEYLLDIKTNLVFDIDDKKLSNNVGSLINGKIKLNK